MSEIHSPTPDPATVARPVASTMEPAPAGTPAKRKNGVPLAAMILGIIAIVAAIIPGFSFVAFLPALAALIFGIIGLASRSAERGKSLTGVILGPIALLVAIVVSVVFVASSVTPKVDTAPDTPAASTETSPDKPAKPSESAASEMGTRANPAPFGSQVEISDASGPIWQVTIGAANLNAGDAVAAENQFNDPAPEGFVYVLVPVTFTYVGTTTGTPWIDVDIEFVSAAGTTHENAYVVIPNPITDVNELYPDASATANLVVLAPATDIEKGAWTVSTFLSDKYFVAVQ